MSCPALAAGTSDSAAASCAQGSLGAPTYAGRDGRAALLVALGAAVAGDAGDAVLARALPCCLVAGLASSTNWVAVTGWTGKGVKSLVKWEATHGRSPPLIYGTSGRPPAASSRGQQGEPMGECPLSLLSIELSQRGVGTPT